MSSEEVHKLSSAATYSMATLNRKSASLMKPFNCNGATDITGFGILGHSENLASIQVADVDLIIDHLPVFSVLKKVDDLIPRLKLSSGTSPETSGGLLMMFS
jgi:selenide,water dikinase